MVFIAQNPARSRASRAPVRLGTLGFALGAGMAAALLVFLLVRSHTPAGASAPDIVCVVAARNIPARTRLTAALLQPRFLSDSRLPEGAFSAPAEVAGKITVQAISAGSAITKDALAAPGAASGLAFALPPSLRAVTIALDPSDGVDQFASPGDHVDILATDEPGSSPAETRTVLQNVALLAVGAQTSTEVALATVSQPPASGVSHVTVAVSPSQAQALVLAAARGKIHLALRPADDEGIAALPPSPASPASSPSQHSLPPPKARPRRRTAPVTVSVALPPIPLSPLPVIAPPRPVTVSITIIKGSQSQTVSVAP